METLLGRTRYVARNNTTFKRNSESEKTICIEGTSLKYKKCIGGEKIP